MKKFALLLLLSTVFVGCTNEMNNDNSSSSSAISLTLTSSATSTNNSSDSSLVSESNTANVEQDTTSENAE